MTDDGLLLRQYAQERSEPAFGELVTRHIDLIYSAALRVASGDRHLAQDVTQVVFIDLARKAWSLPRDVLLAGWLYRHACYTAAKAVRTERRRKTREHTAMEMRALDDNTNPPWELIAPRLDEGLNHLSASDRDAIVLRFLKRQDFRAVGAALGISEDAAQKRVSRALEKLRAVLGRRGVALTATTLASVLAAEAVMAAPVGLAVGVTAASLAATAGTGISLTLLKFMATTKLKTGLVSAVVLAATTTSLVQHRSLSQIRDENRALREQTVQIDRLNGENARLAKLKIDEDELERLRQEHSELIRLRGEVAGLRREAAKVGSLESELAKSRSAHAEEVPRGTSKLVIYNPYLAREAWSDKGTDSPYHAFETMLWAGITGDTQRLAEVTIPGENSVLLKDRPPLMKRKGVQIVSVDGVPDGVTQIGAIVEDEFYGGGLNAPPGTVQGIRFWYLIQTNGEWKATGQKGSW